MFFYFALINKGVLFILLLAIFYQIFNEFYNILIKIFKNKKKILINFESRRQWRRTRQTIGPPRYTNALCDGRRGVDSAFPLPDFASPRGLLAAVDAPIATDCL